MHKNLFCLIALFISTTSNAQLLKSLDYYKLVNMAELAICEEDFTNGHRLYVDAFKMNLNKPFSIDLLNFFKCSMDIKKYGDAEWSMKRLMSRGFTAEMQNELFLYYKSEDSVFIKRLLEKYPNDSAKLKHPFNLAVADMMVSDQGARFHFAKLYDGRYMVDSVYKVDSINATLLKLAFEKYGVLNEDSLGNNFGFPSYHILLLHHKGGFMGGKPSRLLDTLMFEAILKYDVRPEFIAQNFGNGSFSYLLPWTLNDFIQAPITCSAATFNNETYIASFDPEREKLMNQYRAKIGLCTLNEMRRKYTYENSNDTKQKGKYFFSCGIEGVMDCESLESIERWKKSYQYNSK